jgi:tRNA threonylcarbamoyl adenosine modification protein (Sua5/YciO/YrdC/YwlC family)
MLMHVHPDNPQDRLIRQIVECLENDGVIIYPTDTIYAIGCDINSKKAFEHLCRIKNVKPNKVNFSFICSDLSHISDYTLNPSTPIYKMMRRCLPGPYTFILKANNNIPKLFKNNKKTVGIRVPDNNITLQIVKQLGRPLLSTSIHSDDAIIDYMTDPEEIFDKYEKLVDIVIDGGAGGTEPSTIIDCTSGEIEVVRYGKGPVD